MKTKMLTLILFAFFATNAQNTQGIVGEANWFNGWTNFKPKTTEYPVASQILIGDIKENTTLTKKSAYLLMGNVHVASGVTLTIEPGTVIRGDFDTNGTLTVVKGAKIIAEGTQTDPIVFTSNKPSSERKPGDWGGIILMNDAPINRHGGMASSFYEPNPLYSSFGGNNEDADSGVLKYVRIEFAGKKIDQKISLNGLTLAAVGYKTKVDFVQISFANDDAFEAFGGGGVYSNLISYRAFDDDFDFSMGIQCTINNSIAIRNPYTSDNTRSRCFEIDSYDKVEDYDATKKKSLIKLNNVTLLNDEENSMGLIKEAISVKSNSFLEVNKCVVVGFASFIAVDDKYLEGDAYKKIKVFNSRVDSCKELITNEVLTKADNANLWFTQSDKLISISNDGLNNLFVNKDVKKKPDFRLK